MPGRIRADQLPADVRRRFGLDKATGTRARTKREAPEQPSDGAWRCHACGAEFDRWSTAERHCDKAGHHRIDMVL